MKNDFIDYSAIFSYDHFKENYTATIDSEIYGLLESKVKFLKGKMQNLTAPQDKAKYIKDYYRNEKNTAYKHLVTANCLFNETVIYRILELNNTNLTDFIAELSKILTLNTLLKGKSLGDKDLMVKNVLNTIGKWHAYQNPPLIVLKMYEMEYKKTLENKKIKGI